MFTSKKKLFCGLSAVALICLVLRPINAQTPVPVPNPDTTEEKVILSIIVDDVVLKTLDVQAGSLIEFKTTKPKGTKGYWLVYSTEDKATAVKNAFKAAVLSSDEDVARYIRPTNVVQHKVFVTFQAISSDGKRILSALAEINYGVAATPTPTPTPDPTPTPTPSPTPTPNPSVPVVVTPSATDLVLTQDVGKFLTSSNKTQLKEDSVALAVMYNEFANFIESKTDIYTTTENIQTGNKLVGQTMFDGKLKGKYEGLSTAINKSLENKLTLKIETLTPQKRADAVNVLRAIAWQCAEVAKK